MSGAAPAEGRLCDLCWTAGALLRCSKCKAKRYCSPECQKAAWREGHKAECAQLAAEAADRAAAELEEYQRSNPEQPLDVFCGVCLEPLLQPTTLPCQHSFCLECARSSLLAVPRCPSCRARVPTDAPLAPNIVLGMLVRVQTGKGEYDKRLIAESKKARKTKEGASPKQRAAASNEAVQWTLHVDTLTPSGVAMVSLVRKMGIYPSGALTVVEQAAKWCDDIKRVEWEKIEEQECLPRLEGRVGPDTVMLTSPQAIVRTLLDQYSEGLLEPGLSVRASQRAKFVDVCAQVWTKLIRQASWHLFAMVWDHGGMGPFEDLVRALQWTDRQLVPVALEARLEDRLTVLDILAGSVVAFLVQTDSHIVQEALKNLRGLENCAARAASDPSIAATMASLKSHPNKQQYEEYCPSREVRRSELYLINLFSGARSRQLGFAMEPTLTTSWPFLKKKQSSLCVELSFSPYRERVKEDDE